MKPYLETISGGLMTTVQDFGRIGYQSQGIPVGGALDPVMLRFANALVGNPEGTGALEIRVMGPTLKVMADSVRVALAGTSTGIEVLDPERRIHPSHRGLHLAKGQVFRIKLTPDTACCYLAVEGGFDVPAIYNSQSTYIFGGFSGFRGRSLEKGEKIPLNLKAAEGKDRIASGTFENETSGFVRVVLGPQADYFSQKGMETFLGSEYKISSDSNRMGIRLISRRI